MFGTKDADPLTAFVRESNWIEGIKRNPTAEEIEAHKYFLGCSSVTVTSLELFVEKIQPGAVLRSKAGLNVQVGNHYPPEGGPYIQLALEELLLRMPRSRMRAYDYHHEYETLHPFTDGNGRSGRVLWLWMMGGINSVPLGFLHTWYYQSLQAQR